MSGAVITDCPAATRGRRRGGASDGSTGSRGTVADSAVDRFAPVMFLIDCDDKGRPPSILPFKDQGSSYWFFECTHPRVAVDQLIGNIYCIHININIYMHRMQLMFLSVLINNVGFIQHAGSSGVTFHRSLGV